MSENDEEKDQAAPFQPKCWIFWDGKGHRFVEIPKLVNPSERYDTLMKAIIGAQAAGFEIVDLKLTAGAVKL